MSQTILVDGNSLITRCIMASALDDLQAGGLYTGGVYGALNSLRAILARPDIEAGSVFAFFDHGVPKFRKKLFGEFYKAKRKKRRELMSEEEREKAFSQLHTTRLLFETLGVVCLAYHEREADDCLGAAVVCNLLFGTLERAAPVVVSGDKDMWQMIAWGAKMWDINKNRWIDKDVLKAEAGVEAKHYLLWKAMVGDASDCIPGVRGVGPKKAAQVINEYADGSWYRRSDVPWEYVNALVLSLEGKSKRSKFEDQIIEQADWLESVLIGIDLSSSFGKVGGLRKAMTRTPPVDKLKFLKMCKRLHFKSVLGDPNKFLNPFLAAADRR